MTKKKANKEQNQKWTFDEYVGDIDNEWHFPQAFVGVRGDQLHVITDNEPNDRALELSERISDSSFIGSDLSIDLSHISSDVFLPDSPPRDTSIKHTISPVRSPIRSHIQDPRRVSPRNISPNKSSIALLLAKENQESTYLVPPIPPFRPRGQRVIPLETRVGRRGNTSPQRVFQISDYKNQYSVPSIPQFRPQGTQTFGRQNQFGTSVGRRGNISPQRTFQTMDYRSQYSVSSIPSFRPQTTPQISPQMQSSIHGLPSSGSLFRDNSFGFIKTNADMKYPTISTPIQGYDGFGRRHESIDLSPINRIDSTSTTPTQSLVIFGGQQRQSTDPTNPSQ